MLNSCDDLEITEEETNEMLNEFETTTESILYNCPDTVVSGIDRKRDTSLLTGTVRIFVIKLKSCKDL